MYAEPQVTAAVAGDIMRRRKRADLFGFGRGSSLATKDITVIFEKSLDRVALKGNVSKLALDVHRSHDRWRKDDGDIESGHLEACQRAYRGCRFTTTYQVFT